MNLRQALLLGVFDQIQVLITQLFAIVVMSLILHLDKIDRDACCPQGSNKPFTVTDFHILIF